MRVLIVHNQLWAHYKSKLFSEIYKAVEETGGQDQLLVAQIALYEASRKDMQPDDAARYSYPYQVLFERSLDQVGLTERRKALFRVFDQYKPSVLNITGYFDWAQVLLMCYARLKGVKVVISSESSAADHNRSAWREWVKRMIVNRAHAFFCFGKTSAQYLESLGIAPGHIAVRNAAVIDENLVRARYDAAKQAIGPLKRDPFSKQFVYVGRLAPEKNLDMLLRAFAKVTAEEDSGASWKLLLVGEGPERAALEALSKTLGIAGSFGMPGGFPWYQVPDWLAQSDVLILPSKSEPWGLVVNEAMVCGMPVIVSQKCGCVADLVQNGVNGFVFDPAEQTQLETHIRFFLRNPDSIPAMGRESLRLIAPFAAGPVARKMVQTYRDLDQNKKAQNTTIH
nr:glycosyltransferase family 4 protein [uncultured Dyadobacter sp.]